jgi:chemotaxis protein MotB
MRLTKTKKASSTTIRRFPEERDAWLLSYADIITMLLCFFVLFFSTDKKKSSSEISDVFSFIQKELGLEKNTKAENLKKIKDLVKNKYGDEKLVSELKKLNIAGTVQVLSYKHFISIDFPKGDMFDRGADKLSEKALKEITPIIQSLKTHQDKLNINIVAYTDPTPVNQRSRVKRWWTNNRELSAQRALNVQNLFLANGFSPETVFITGRGVKEVVQNKEDQPIGLDGRIVDTQKHNDSRTISIRLEAKDSK